MSASLVVQPSLIFPFPYHCSWTSHKVPDRDPGLSLTLCTLHLYSHIATTGKSQESPWEGRYALLFAKAPTTVCCSPGLMNVSDECVQFVQIHRNFNFVYYLHMLYLSFFKFFKKLKSRILVSPCKPDAIDIIFPHFVAEAVKMWKNQTNCSLLYSCYMG